MSFASRIARVTIITTALAAVACKSDSTTNPTTPTGALTVHSPHVTAGPAIDGDASDGVWSSAQWTTIHMKPVQVPNNTLTGEFDLTVKSVHTDDEVFLLVQYPDATEDIQPNRLIFAGGDPSVSTNWSNSNSGQDGMSIMWNMMLNGAPARDPGGKFTDSAYGCQAACHGTLQPSNPESGMYPDSGEVDLWFWNAGTTNQQGYADDQYAVGADATDQPDVNRRFKDANTEKFFADANFSIGSPNLPNNVAGGTNNSLDRNKYLWSNSSVKFSPTSNNPATNAPWAAGDGIPGWALRVTNLLSSETDVVAKGVHANGMWTIELKRARQNLYTDQDVQFTGNGTYPFSIATHDNSRKYTNWQYQGLGISGQPSHYGSVPRRVLLSIE